MCSTTRKLVIICIFFVSWLKLFSSAFYLIKITIIYTTFVTQNFVETFQFSSGIILLNLNFLIGKIVGAYLNAIRCRLFRIFENYFETFPCGFVKESLVGICSGLSEDFIKGYWNLLLGIFSKSLWRLFNGVTKWIFLKNCGELKPEFLIGFLRGYLKSLQSEFLKVLGVHLKIL